MIQINTLKNLDIFLRYYGDSISRKKSNLFGELISAPRPRGGAVVTGEICASGESSLLRTLTIIIPKGGMNGEALKTTSIEHTSSLLFSSPRELIGGYLLVYIKLSNAMKITAIQNTVTMSN